MAIHASLHCPDSMIGRFLESRVWLLAITGSHLQGKRVHASQPQDWLAGTSV